YRTKDYEAFDTIRSNREVVEKHVRALMKAISKRNLLHLMPGIANSSGELLDGQHRLEAARRLGEWFYYIVDDNITEEDIAVMNTNKRNWTVTDYVNYYSVKKHPDFIKLSKFIHLYPQIQIGNALILLSSTGSRKTRDIRIG